MQFERSNVWQAKTNLYKEVTSFWHQALTLLTAMVEQLLFILRIHICPLILGLKSTHKLVSSSHKLIQWWDSMMQCDCYMVSIIIEAYMDLSLQLGWRCSEAWAKSDLFKTLKYYKLLNKLKTVIYCCLETSLYCKNETVLCLTKSVHNTSTAICTYCLEAEDHKFFLYFVFTFRRRDVRTIALPLEASNPVEADGLVSSVWILVQENFRQQSPRQWRQPEIIQGHEWALMLQQAQDLRPI